eukprot:Sspe_Gene.6082::Locus_2036_Transcript_1_1_Confidence_1.000_Length_1651::g.6082::m.6082
MSLPGCTSTWPSLQQDFGRTLPRRCPQHERGGMSSGDEKLLTGVRAVGEDLDQAIHSHGVEEERLSHRLRTELGLLAVQIDEERVRRKHMETIFVSLMESIITRLYQEMDLTFNERKEMDARLRDHMLSVVSKLQNATGTVL